MKVQRESTTSSTSSTGPVRMASSATASEPTTLCVLYEARNDWLAGLVRLKESDSSSST